LPAEYSIRPLLRRVFVPHILRTLGLILVFAFAVILNLILLKVELGALIYAIVIVVMLIVLALDAILLYSNMNLVSYDFYPDRIDIKGKKEKSIMFKDMAEIKMQKNVFDNLFRTASLQLTAKYSLKALINPEQVRDYAQKLWQRNNPTKTSVPGPQPPIQQSQQPKQAIQAKQ